MRAFDVTFYIAPEDSYSRRIDKTVFAEEMPYGYTLPPPPADTHDYDMRKYESRKDISTRKLR